MRQRCRFPWRLSGSSRRTGLRAFKGAEKGFEAQADFGVTGRLSIISVATSPALLASVLCVTGVLAVARVHFRPLGHSCLRPRPEPWWPLRVRGSRGRGGPEAPVLPVR